MLYPERTMQLSLYLGAALAAAAAVHADDSATTTPPPSSSTSGKASDTASATTSSATGIQTHQVAVGAEGFKFTPNEIDNAAVGDVVEFRFYPGGHTVVQAEFGYPCIPYDYTGANKVGFYSGQLSPQVITPNLPTYQVKINHTNPIFFYCSAPGSCINQHMIGMAYAGNATLQLSPGDPWPSETLGPRPTGTAPTLQATTSTTPPASSGSSTSLGAGPIAGIAIGGAALLMLAGALIYLCGRKGGARRDKRRSAATYQSGEPMEQPFHYISPKSPGQETFTTQGQYSVSDNGARNSSPQPGFFSPQSPPGSHPGIMYQSLGAQDPRHHATSSIGSGAQMHGDGTDGRYGQNGAYFDQQRMTHSPQPRSQSPAPVELPSSENPGNSPLPDYQPNRQFSWAQGQENGYRPGKV